MKIALLISLVVLAACSPPQSAEPSAGVPTPTPAPAPALAARCDLSITRDLALVSATSKDTLEIKADGADCATSVITIAIRPHGGEPQTAFTTPVGILQSTLDVSQPIAPETLAAFLQAYAADAQLDVGATQLPEWKAGSPSPGFDEGQELGSSLARESYEALRITRPNMLCLMDAPDSSVCYVWDPKAAKPVAIVQHG